MAAQSSIEWTEATWNPVTGCTKISQGCKHCYAERMAKRLQKIGVKQYRNGFKVTLAPHVLHIPYAWNSPKTVFVNSMSDLFHEDIPLDYIQKIFEVMNNTPRHTYQILTKRSERLAKLSPCLQWPPNVWMGVSVENQDVVHRIKNLAKVNAKIKFLSIEPLIGQIKTLCLDHIDWVIVGGESGPNARPLKIEWVNEIFRLCRQKGIPFFFKQWGKQEFNVNPHDPTIHKNHPFHAKGGCQLNGKTYREMPIRRYAISAPF